MSNRESYAHHSAKHILRDWLSASYNPRTEINCVEVNRGGVHEVIAWSSGLSQPYGAWLEYPWDGDGMTWNEVADRESITFNGDQKLIPTLDEYRERNGGRYPKVIWDIAIQHKGAISTAFEVVWKSDISPKKHDIIKNSTVTVYTVSAMWILKQTEPPACIIADSRIEPWDI